MHLAFLRRFEESGLVGQLRVSPVSVRQVLLQNDRWNMGYIEYGIQYMEYGTLDMEEKEQEGENATLLCVAALLTDQKDTMWMTQMSQ